jgi:hypothetical protein
MEIDGNIFPAKNSRFECKICNFKCSKKSNWLQHIKTKKHVYHKDIDTLGNAGNEKNSLICKNCQKEYLSSSGLWKHMKGKCSKINYEICNVINKNVINKNVIHENVINENVINEKLIIELLKQNQELQKSLIELSKEKLIINTNNSNNKTFNLNVFLNETCKNAMNISDFADTIKLQLSDLESVGELGYVNGLSNIIIKHLKELDITQRPIHCTDAKRETLYIKDKDKWEKEGEQKEIILKFVNNVANKNIRMLSEFKKKYPDCCKYESKYSDYYSKLIIEAMGGSGGTDAEKHEKIIKKICKEVTVDKNVL